MQFQNASCTGKIRSGNHEKTQIAQVRGQVHQQCVINKDTTDTHNYFQKPKKKTL